MGSGQSQPNTHVIIIDRTRTSYEWFSLIYAIMSENGATYEHFSDIQYVLETHTQEQLKNIIAMPDNKDEIIRFMVQHHLRRTKLYVWMNGQDTSQEDFDNAYITLLEDKLETIVDHIKMNTQTELFMPLLQINRELQKKVNVKLIFDNDSENQVKNPLRLLPAKLEEAHLSFELFINPQKLEDSTLLSISDFIICNKLQFREVLDIARARLKKASIIYLKES